MAKKKLEKKQYAEMPEGTSKPRLAENDLNLESQNVSGGTNQQIKTWIEYESRIGEETADR